MASSSESPQQFNYLFYLNDFQFSLIFIDFQARQVYASQSMQVGTGLSKLPGQVGTRGGNGEKSWATVVDTYNPSKNPLKHSLFGEKSC